LPKDGKGREKKKGNGDLSWRTKKKKSTLTEAPLYVFVGEREKGLGRSA